MYLTLDEFEARGGKTFDFLSEFDALCRKAQSYIDFYTQGRIKAEDDVCEGVKQAMFEICELILTGNSDVKSYSSDGVSVTMQDSTGFDEKIFEIVKRNIPTKLLFLGVDRNDR